FDRGDEPSPAKYPNPEDPILYRHRKAQMRQDIYKYNDTHGGTLNWWSSEDIRISDVAEGTQPPPLIDAVSVESCPIATVTAGASPPGTIRDESPTPGSASRVFIQVHNMGTMAAHNVRVMALWAPHTPSPPPLPRDFWKTTFPPRGSAFGPLQVDSRW